MALNADDLDVVRDALGLVEACHRGDLEGARCLLDNGNARLIATFLSRLCCDLIEDVIGAPEETLIWLRDRHGAGA